jgi:hypothetical protein
MGGPALNPVTNVFLSYRREDTGRREDLVNTKAKTGVIQPQGMPGATRN